MSRKKEEVSIRLTPDEIAKRSMDARNAVIEEALKAEKVRYKSTNDPEKFQTFLEDRLELWRSLKSGTTDNTRLKKGYTTRYFERMFDKTNDILTNLETSTD